MWADGSGSLRNLTQIALHLPHFHTHCPLLHSFRDFGSAPASLLSNSLPPTPSPTRGGSGMDGWMDDWVDVVGHVSRVVSLKCV